MIKVLIIGIILIGIVNASYNEWVGPNPTAIISFISGHEYDPSYAKISINWAIYSRTTEVQKVALWYKPHDLDPNDANNWRIFNSCKWTTRIDESQSSFYYFPTAKEDGFFALDGEFYYDALNPVNVKMFKCDIETPVREPNGRIRRANLGNLPAGFYDFLVTVEPINCDNGKENEVVQWENGWESWATYNWNPLPNYKVCGDRLSFADRNPIGGTEIIMTHFFSNRIWWVGVSDPPGSEDQFVLR
jgi:hypothetical protein